MPSTGTLHELSHCFPMIRAPRETLEARGSHCLIKENMYMDL